MPECFNSPYAVTAFPKYAEVVPNHAGELQLEQSPSTAMLIDAAIEHGIYFVEPRTSEPGDRSTHSTFLATRYDYLRMSKAMLDDWQNDTCEGKYLKSLFERKIKKNQQWENNKDSFGLTKYYAGFFHTGLKGMKNRPIFIMDGYGGQIFTIDFERGRIVATIAIHRDFNWKKIGYSVIKKGK